MGHGARSTGQRAQGSGTGQKPIPPFEGGEGDVLLVGTGYGAGSMGLRARSTGHGARCREN